MKLYSAINQNSVNLIVFNLMWIGLVLGRESFLFITVPVVIGYVTFLITSGRIKAYQLLVPAGIGISVDSLLTIFGIFSFANSNFLIPLWLIMLWLAFSTTLTHSLSFLSKHWFIAAIAGGVAFPFNYAVGERLGAVTFDAPFILTMLVIGIVWLFLLPVLYFVIRDSLKNEITT
ncbi:MAG: DUF2878 domain-containing protein [Gammaproteobacteria bacterium]|nr:DUF2878 domain-containing protein [Gammaproteobacteria bacterium]MDD9896794.1 DUF2878 domain-containing protein [Gammaproteobacteria bacterium]MDD9959359.1 DUF2878 domain-containing protein [Gammaproteobacteria bacterium]